MNATIHLSNGDEFSMTGGLLRLRADCGAFEGYAPACRFHPGDVVAQARIEADGSVLHEGPLRIDAVVDTGTGFICEFTLPTTRPSTLPAWSGKRDAAPLQECFNRWRSTTHLSPEYRLLIHDMASLFANLWDWTQKLEMGCPADTADGLAWRRATAKDFALPVAGAIDSVWEAFELLASRIKNVEHVRYRSYLRTHLMRYLMTSPFACRSFIKPLGYAGDYQCVNMIAGDPCEGETLFGMLVNAWLLNQLPSRAHRSRIDYLEQMLRLEACRQAALGRRLRVFNLGCGPAIEIQRFLNTEETSNSVDFTLLDFNRETIEYTRAQLAGVARQRARKAAFRYVNTNVREFLRDTARGRWQEKTEYDLIYCAGLFDYLPDAVCAQLLELLAGWLRPGGFMVATNVKATPAIALSLDYMLDWQLIYRSESQFRALLSERPGDDQVSVLGVEHGYNLFLEMRKGGRAHDT